MDEPRPPPYLRDLAFFLTFRCQIACAHCFVQAGPHRTEVMREAEAGDWIVRAARYDGLRIKAIAFTGGEPFLELALLRRLLALAESQGLLASCASNAFWAETPATATRILRGLPGLVALQVSADVHHQARIPFESVRNALRAAQELGLAHAVSVCTEDAEDPAHLRLVERLRELVEPGAIRVTVTQPLGRALLRLRRAGAGASAGARAGVRCGGAESPYVLPDGRVLACIPALGLGGDHPLRLGDLRTQPLEEVLDAAETSYALHQLRLYGPARLREALVARGLDAGTAPPSGDGCAQCLHLMSRPGIRPALAALTADEDGLNLLAAARLHHLGEDAMARRLGLDLDLDRDPADAADRAG